MPPEPPPPLIVTVGADVYPVPPLVNVNPVICPALELDADRVDVSVGVPPDAGAVINPTVGAVV